MKGDYIYVEINDSRLGLLEKIKVEGVFQSPTEVDELNKCDKCGSHSIDDEYKLPSHQVPVLKQMILEDLLRGVQLPSDKVNNSSNDIGSGVKAE